MESAAVSYLKSTSSLLKNLEIEALLSSEGPGFW